MCSSLDNSWHSKSSLSGTTRPRASGNGIGFRPLFASGLLLFSCCEHQPTPPSGIIIDPKALLVWRDSTATYNVTPVVGGGSVYVLSSYSGALGGTPVHF